LPIVVETRARVQVGGTKARELSHTSVVAARARVQVGGYDEPQEIRNRHLGNEYPVPLFPYSLLGQAAGVIDEAVNFAVGGVNLSLIEFKTGKIPNSRVLFSSPL
jgi:hypothetical protein